MPLIDLTGQRFGRLMVVGRGKRSSHRAYWRCVCDCGREMETRGCSLRGGVSSCGCLGREALTEGREKRIASHPDLVGTRFGRLTVLRPAGRRGPYKLWECSCACGAAKTKTVPTGHLKSGHTMSCGCLNNERIALVADLFHPRNGSARDRVTPELIELKREQLGWRRLLKEYLLALTEQEKPNGN